MDIGFLQKLFGVEQHWHGPCTVVVEADASIQNAGTDAIVGGGAKAYAPRIISGRINADAICLLKDGAALLIIQQQRIRQPTGEEIIKQSLTATDPTHVVAVEFLDTSPLTTLGLPVPAPKTSGSHSGTSNRPK